MEFEFTMSAKLKNGSEEAKPFVDAFMLQLRSLFQIEPMAFYEAVQVARNPSHEPFGISRKKLRDAGIIENKGMHESVRSVIISAVEGDGLNMTLGSPYA